MSPTGPIHSVEAQIYLPIGSEVLGVQVDGKSVDYTEFGQQGRPAVLLDVRLPPRQTRTVDVRISEPASSVPAEVTVQPLNRDQNTVIQDGPC